MVINDLDKLIPQMFVDAISGKYDKETRVIDRETFFRIKEHDAYAKLCYSFGNRGATYLWGGIGDIKLTICQMLMNDNVFERYTIYRKLVRMLKQSENIDTTLDNIRQIESISRLKRIRSLSTLSGYLNMIEHHSGDYQDVDIDVYKGVIYCDIPYRNAETYTSGMFDYERFYEWTRWQKLSVYISEYNMPEDLFECVAEIEKTVKLSSTSNNTASVERLFVPK